MGLGDPEDRRTSLGADLGRFIGSCRLRHDLVIGGDLGSEVRIGVGQGTRFG
jgi:hypothetical protein